jgi:hypothetical protein
MSGVTASAEAPGMSVRVEWRPAAIPMDGAVFRVESPGESSGVIARRQVSAVPARSWQSRCADVGVDVHLRADPDVGWSQEWADVLVGSDHVQPADVQGRVVGLLGHFPGCLVAAVPDTRGGCVVGVHGGAVLRVVPERAVQVSAWAVVGSFLHAWLVSGGAVHGLRGVVLEGGRGRRVRLGVQES